MNPEPKDIPPSAETFTLLVVDDEPLSLEVVEKELIQEGYRVVTASEGQEALTHLLIQLEGTFQASRSPSLAV